MKSNTTRRRYMCVYLLEIVSWSTHYRYIYSFPGGTGGGKWVQYINIYVGKLFRKKSKKKIRGPRTRSIPNEHSVFRLNGNKKYFSRIRLGSNWAFYRVDRPRVHINILSSRCKQLTFSSTETSGCLQHQIRSVRMICPRQSRLKR